MCRIHGPIRHWRMVYMVLSPLAHFGRWWMDTWCACTHDAGLWCWSRDVPISWLLILTTSKFLLVEIQDEHMMCPRGHANFIGRLMVSTEGHNSSRSRIRAIESDFERAQPALWWYYRYQHQPTEGTLFYSTLFLNILNLVCVRFLTADDIAFLLHVFIFF